MTVNTYWHDNNLDPSDYLTTSDASTTYVPKNDATPALSIDSNVRKLYASDGTTEMMDWAIEHLYDEPTFC
jgi:hypothetical protein